MTRLLFALSVLLLQEAPHQIRPPAAPSIGEQTALASWYGLPYHGRKTANGERYNMYALTAASLNLPFGSWVEVTLCRRSVVVRINDRMPPGSGGRILDLSLGAATRLGLVQPGFARVRWRVVND